MVVDVEAPGGAPVALEGQIDRPCLAKIQRRAKLAADVGDVVLLVEGDDVAGHANGSPLILELHLIEVVGRQVESLPAESADRPNLEGQPEEMVGQLVFQVEREHLAVGPRFVHVPRSVNEPSAFGGFQS